jgi:hypothetical protein
MPWYCHFLVGLVVGGFAVDLIHSYFTYLAYQSVKHLAEQNVELYNELKEKDDWTGEGEEWKNR